MKIRKRYSNSAIESISRLIDMQYTPANEELNSIHQRLMAGRDAFEQAVTKTVDAVILMSNMDLTLETNVAVVEQINTSISDAVDHISESSQSTADIASEVSKAHENLTSTIIEVSSESSKIMEDINNCEHFYYAFKPINAKIIDIWNGLDEKHKTFHSYGTQMIAAVRSGRLDGLQQIYEKAENYSKGLLSDLHKLIQIIDSLTNEHVRIFE